MAAGRRQHSRSRTRWSGSRPGSVGPDRVGDRATPPGSVRVVSHVQAKRGRGQELGQHVAEVRLASLITVTGETQRKNFSSRPPTTPETVETPSDSFTPTVSESAETPGACFASSAAACPGSEVGVAGALETVPFTDWPPFRVLSPLREGSGRKFFRSPVSGWTHSPAASSGNSPASSSGDGSPGGALEQLEMRHQLRRDAAPRLAVIEHARSQGRLAAVLTGPLGEVPRQP